MKFCGECGTALGETTPAAPHPLVPALTDAEQVAILNEVIAEFRSQGWHEWTARPTIYSVSLRRKSGLMARQFMAVWVNDDGGVWKNYVGEGGTLRSIPTAIRGQAPMNPELVRPSLAARSSREAALAYLEMLDGMRREGALSQDAFDNARRLVLNSD